jgi:glucose-6-phosphate isomerase
MMGSNMSERLVLDYNNMLAPRVGPRGLEPAHLDEAAARFVKIHEAVERRRAAGELGFFELPWESGTVGEIRAFAEGVGQAFDTVVVLGIGGSALGATALHRALRPPFWNERTDEARDYFPRLYVLDNIDPDTIGPFLDNLDLARTLFSVVSKSGSTAETLAQFLVVRQRLLTEFDDEGYRRHLIFTTDPREGALRRIAESEAIATLPVPPNVGGRFSVLSAVGLLPAALVGIDIDALLEGARAMAERCRAADLRENPAGLYAALQYSAHTQRGAAIHVMMPYADHLAATADWFQQLWAESLGKRVDVHGETVFRGPTPIRALGATDQHSQVQLYIEGPFDKTITFVAPAVVAEDVAIPGGYPEFAELAYLGGRTLGQLLEAERVATTGALASEGRMNMTIELPHIDANAIGQLLMMLQIATIYAGAFYEVDPLGQPGVELGKRLTYALMGRPGYDAPPSATRDPRWICR